MNDSTKENELNAYSPDIIFSPEFVIQLVN